MREGEKILLIEDIFKEAWPKSFHLIPLLIPTRLMNDANSHFRALLGVSLVPGTPNRVFSASCLRLFAVLTHISSRAEVLNRPLVVPPG